MSMELKCLKCSFKWKPRTESIPRTCPYCGKENCVTDNSPEDFKDINDIL